MSASTFGLMRTPSVPLLASSFGSPGWCISDAPEGRTRLPRPLALGCPAKMAVLGASFAGELRSLVGVEDVGPAMAGDRVFESGNAEVGIQRVRQPPCQHLAAEPVHDGDEVEEAAPH